jgi:hypothetical protein
MLFQTTHHLGAKAQYGHAHAEDACPALPGTPVLVLQIQVAKAHTCVGMQNVNPGSSTR